MFNLISRDLILQKKFLLVYVAVILIFVLMNKHDPAFIFILASIFIPFNTLAYDEKTETNILLNSLPYTRTEIVTARYVGAIIYTLLSIAFTSLLFVVFGHTFTVRDAAIGLGLFLIFAAFTFPLFYILKPGNISTAVLISFILLSFIGPSVFMYAAEKLTFITQFIQSLSEFALYAGAAVTIVVIYSLSWLLATTAYKRKAF